MRGVVRYVLVGLVVMSASCNGGDDESAPGPTTTSAAPTTSTVAPTTTLSAEAQAVRDYQAGMTALSDALNPPNPDHPELLRFWTGDALRARQSQLSQLLDQRVGIENAVETHPQIASIRDDVATIDDCAVDHSQLIDLETGQSAGESGTTNVNIEARLERADGVWQIAVFTQREQSCTPG